MKNTIRCCISCILPCGALDVIRIVHSNGRVEEISGTIKASEIMKAHPKHVLKKPSSSSDDGIVPKIVIVPPDAELQRGKIYFLMPVPSTSMPEKSARSRSSSTTTPRKKKTREADSNRNRSCSNTATTNNHSRNSSGGAGNNKSNTICMTTNLLVSDQYLSEILSEKLSTQRDRRRGRVGVWRPHLESISEAANDA